jgi:uncharacterized protein YcbK (DUF882 family)
LSEDLHLRKRVFSRIKQQPLAVLVTIAFLCVAAAANGTPTNGLREYRLRLLHTHTGERLNILYRRGDQYIPEALERLDYFLRDHRTGDVRHYDPQVFDLLRDLTAKLGEPDTEVDVVCGYRTPWSNEFLRTHGHGVASHSLHMQAMAIDIRVPGVKTSNLRDAALALHRGGVGYYASSEFVHVDVGRVRRW